MLTTINFGVVRGKKERRKHKATASTNNNDEKKMAKKSGKKKESDLAINITIKNHVLFKKVITAMMKLIPSLNLHFDEKGIRVAAMDAATVSMVGLHLVPSFFDVYEIDEPRVVGLNLESVAKIFKHIKKDVHIAHIQMYKSDESTVLFGYKHVKTGETCQFSVTCMLIDTEFREPDSHESGIVLDMPSGYFKERISMLALAGDTIDFLSEEEGVVKIRGTSATQAEIKSAEIELKSNKEVAFDEVDEDDGDDGGGKSSRRNRKDIKESKDYIKVRKCKKMTVSYSQKYISIIADAATCASRILISCSRGNPLVASFCINGDSMMQIFLAPKFDENGEDDENGGDDENVKEEEEGEQQDEEGNVAEDDEDDMQE